MGRRHVHTRGTTTCTSISVGRVHLVFGQGQRNMVSIWLMYINDENMQDTHEYIVDMHDHIYNRICIPVYLLIYMCLFVNARVYVHVCMCMCEYVRVCACMCVWVHMQV